MWLIKLTSFLDPPASFDPEWEHLRLQIMQRFVKLLVVVLSLIALRNWFYGLALVWVPLVVIALGLLVWGLLELYPRSRRPAVWLLAFAIFCLMAVGVRYWTGPPPAAAFMFIPLLATLGAVLEGVLLSSLLFALGLGLQVYGWQAYASEPLEVRVTLGMSVALCGALFSSMVAWQRVLDRGLVDLHASKNRLLQTIDERQALTFALFGGLAKALQQLRSDLQATAGDLDWKRVQHAANEVRTRMEEVRQFRQSLPSEPVPSLKDGDFARGVMQSLLWVGLLISATGWLFHLASGQGKAWSGPLALGVLGAGLLSLRGGRPPTRPLTLAVVLLGPFILVITALTSSGPGLPPSLQFWLLSILNTGLLMDFGAAAVVTALGLFLLGVLLVDPNLPRGGFHMASNLAATWAFGLFIVLQAMVWQKDLLSKVAERGQAIATSLRLRRRLLGTFFHDLANPLGAVLAAAELGRAGLGQAADAQRALRLCDRMLELLGPSQDLLLEDMVIPRSRLQVVELQPLVAAMHELYADRLTAKPVLLVDEVPAGLSVLAVPSMLRDSVLSNLVSNAIKFSPPGGQVELDAWMDGAWVVMGVRDRGPGLAAGTQDALALGQDLASTAGSSGEAGQGLGLALASEHLQRLGGRLELRERPQGGTEALIWLPLG